MKFGIFGGARRGLHDITGDSTGYRDFIDYIRAADENGFHNVFLTEHHFTGQESLSASLNLCLIWPPVPKTSVSAPQLQYCPGTTPCYSPNR